MTGRTEQISSLKSSANAAIQANRLHDAEGIWQRVLELDAHDCDAHFALGYHAHARGDRSGAIDRFRASLEYSPDNPLFRLTVARSLKASGDLEGHFVALTAALAADPYFLPAILMRAESLGEIGKRVDSVQSYRDALTIAPPEEHWPANLRDQLRHGRKLVANFEEALEIHLLEAIGQSGLPNKWQETVSIMAGRTKPYRSQCNQLHVPRLPAMPFYDPNQFAWAAELEAQTPAILAELQAMLAQREADFTPYIAYQPGDPVNQWADLNHSKRWSGFSLWRGGVRDEANLAACPQTEAALSKVEMAQIGGLCPNAMFSALAPHTEIPPHTGETNARLVVHLPLIVPPKCHYRVGYEERQWEVGKLLIFDDTLEHTARNDSDELRVVLIFDIWNPHLSSQERAMVQSLTDAARAFGRD